MSYINRTDAGRRLAGEVARRLAGQDVVVLGLPRGGVPVAFEIATALSAPLDVIVVRKIGVPFHPEWAMGAIGEDGARIVHQRAMTMAGVSEQAFAEVEERERRELERRIRQFRGDRPRIPLRGRTAVIVDDGVATGSTARAACQVARHLGASRVVVAIPVGAPDAVARLEEEADEVICPLVPEIFSAIGQWYTDFTQTPDREVTELLARAAARPRVEQTPAPGRVDEEVEIQAGPIRLPGHVTVPERAVGMVVFAHGSGSGRHSPRNRYVAAELQRGGSPWQPSGSGSARRPHTCRSAISGRVRGPRRHWWRRPHRTVMCRPWCPAAAARIWLGRRWSRYVPPPCSLWAATTCTSST